MTLQSLINDHTEWVIVITFVLAILYFFINERIEKRSKRLKSEIDTLNRQVDQLGWSLILLGSGPIPAALFNRLGITIVEHPYSQAQELSVGYNSKIVHFEKGNAWKTSTRYNPDFLLEVTLTSVLDGDVYRATTVKWEQLNPELQRAVSSYYESDNSAYNAMIEAIGNNLYKAFKAQRQNEALVNLLKTATLKRSI